MEIYCISYDLGKPKRDYENLFSFLESFKDNFHALESVWFVRTGLSAKEIKSQISNLIDGDDQVFVIEVQKHWSFKINKNIPDWMRS